MHPIARRVSTARLLGTAVYPFVMTLHIVLSALLIIIILMQPGKGADISSAFGGGGGTQLFGASGPGNFLTRGTGTIAFLFMVTSISLALMGPGSAGGAGEEVDDVAEEEEGAGFGNAKKEAPGDLLVPTPGAPELSTPPIELVPAPPPAPEAVSPPAAPAPSTPEAPPAP